MAQVDLNKLTDEIRSEFPSFKLVPKSKSALMKAVNVFLLVITFGQMKNFMTRFTTTVGNAVYTPDVWSRYSDTQRAVILRHERVHMRQRKKYSLVLFGFLYILVFFPIGLAYFRMKFEKEAYEESMRATVEYYGIHLLEVSNIRKSYVDHFTTSQYVWMWPFRRSIERWYDGMLEELRS